MQLIAHRGLTTKYIKENTLESFKYALKNGYVGIELDVRMTIDKKIVVLHDSLINRTSNGIGNINKLTYKKVKKYNFGSKKIKSKIPLLYDVIKEFSNIIIFIELKEKINEDILYNTLKQNNTNEYYIMSFNKQYIDNLNNIHYKKGIINYVFNSNINIKSYDFILILEDLFNEKINNRLNKVGIEVVLYGVLNNISLKNKININNIKYII